MAKKAQVTIFIILAIVILSILGFLFYIERETLKSLWQGEIQRSIVIPQQIKPVHSYVESCLKETSLEGLHHIGQHGGYHNVPGELSLVFSSVAFLKDEIPYFYLNNKSYIPNIKHVERELSLYVMNNIKSCLDFEELKKQGFKIEFGKFLISTKIEDKSITTKMVSSILVEKEDISAKINDFSSAIQSNIKKLLETANEAVDIYAKNSGIICLTCFDELPEKNNVDIKIFYYKDVVEYEEDILWFLITDKEYQLNNKNFTLQFVVEK